VRARVLALNCLLGYFVASIWSKVLLPACPCWWQLPNSG